MGGSVLVATPGSALGTFIELQLLIIPQHHIHIPPILRVTLRVRVMVRVRVRVRARVRVSVRVRVRGGGMSQPQSLG